MENRYPVAYSVMILEELQRNSCFADENALYLRI